MEKHVEIARLIEREIHGGSWATGRMPGVRILAKQYRTSVVTASRALQELTIRGLIQTVERSGCYVRPQVQEGDLWALCQRITPGPWREQMGPTFEGELDAAFRKDGSRLRTDMMWFTDETPEIQLRRDIQQAQSQGVKGVFFLPSRKSEISADQDVMFLETCRTAGMPVVLLERGLRGGRPLTHDVVGYDDLTAARELTRHLVAAERRRIAFVIGSPTSSHEARLSGYLLSITLDADHQSPLIVAEDPTLPAKEGFASLASQLREIDADAVVCYQDYTAVGLILELLHRRVQVPEEIAVTGFEDRPIGNSFAIGVTTYAFSDFEIGRQALKLMRGRIAHPDAPPVRVAVTGHLVIRESSGPPVTP